MNDIVGTAVLAFSGEMSTAVLKEKLRLLGEKRTEIFESEEKIKQILASRKYTNMTMQEIGAKWDGLDRYNRLAMALEIPEIRERFEELIRKKNWDEQQVEDYVCADDWEDLSGEIVEIKQYFEEICKA